MALVYLGIFVKRRHLLELLSLLLYRNRKDLNNCYAKRFLGRFCIYAGLSGLCAVTYTSAFLFSEIPVVPCILLSFIYTYSYVLIGLIMILYSCLAQVLAALLHLYNHDLLAATKTTKIERCGLWKRNQMLIVCHEQLNSGFGLVMALITAFALFSAPAAPFILVTTVFELDINQVGINIVIRLLLICIMWNIPWLVAMMIIFQKDAVWQEVCTKGFNL
ncbi:uncharacterized protein Dvir_GJ25655 [Drosophila virilis]|uniref:Gustatory receptor n=1 Tax=Drosophila virilis TaxID=7244 RepID=A0A0Q9WBZ4_DROVI|nr:uncharacterized protein Dvir_GJ25655 [Drosophila virilis]